ncbi:hypothetical protein I601_2129 [Nocardioides dokdonensis FR1436]|uniref:Uncharacterized protein n=2 Tax=Nocardioides TaxID=1839 RepID=A0A1A9GJW8_9ACTN|nr:hypothetical protein I601_2129 [Nocardioides dokdonensis FR1436]
MIGGIISKVLGGGRGGSRRGGAVGTPGAGGAGMGGTRGGSSKDAAIGRGVRGVLGRFTRR